MNSHQFDRLTKGLDTNSQEYKHYKQLLNQAQEKEARAKEYRLKVWKRLWTFAPSVRSELQTSKLKNVDTDNLIEIGKAVKALYLALEKAGCYRDATRETHSSDW
jgi:hypothetical protein